MCSVSTIRVKTSTPVIILFTFCEWKWHVASSYASFTHWWLCSDFRRMRGEIINGTLSANWLCYTAHWYESLAIYNILDVVNKFWALNAECLTPGFKLDPADENSFLTTSFHSRWCHASLSAAVSDALYINRSRLWLLCQHWEAV